MCEGVNPLVVFVITALLLVSLEASWYVRPILRSRGTLNILVTYGVHDVS